MTAGSAGGVLESEVLIAGGGMVGLTLGAALAGAGVEVVAVERTAPAQVRGAAYDGRASAIARGSQQVLAGLGLWPRLAAEAQPILDIRVSDGRIGRGASPFVLHYACEDLAGPGAEAAPLGYIVENRAIRAALHEHLADLANFRLRAPARLVDLDRGAGGRPAEARLDDGTRVRAPLVVAADGKDSPVRRAAGIPVTTWDYPQTAIVATVHHARAHHGVAHEHFLPSGPFALLPMTDAPGGAHRSSLVWTERRALAPAMLALDAAAFGRELERRFGDTLGRLREVGGRWAYPLGLMHAARYVERRLALVGDAAHVIHPIAGQGLNLGLRDVAALAEVVVDVRRLGLDAGELEALARYERWRRLDNTVLMVVTDGLNRLFSNDVGPLRLARDLGLAAVNELAPLKRLFMRHAMGLVGDLPRLVRGEAL